MEVKRTCLRLTEGTKAKNIILNVQLELFRERFIPDYATRYYSKAEILDKIENRTEHMLVLN